MDFCTKKYLDLMNAIHSTGYEAYGISEWLEKSPQKGILVRHDVDRKAANSLKIAQIESQFGFRTTYYFRITPGSFQKDIIKEIAQMGHEIGYHYEDLASNNGNMQKAIVSFESNLDSLRKLSKIKTIAMHGSPLSRYDNKLLWNTYNFEKFGIESEAFLSIDYGNMYYFTDTGRSWSNRAINLRDRVKSLDVDLKNTDELINFIVHNPNFKIALVTHPERWSDSIGEYGISYLSDKTANLIKNFIKAIRG